MIRLVDKLKYDIQSSGHPMLNQELAWYANEDDSVIGVVLLDKIDNDFSWVMMTQNEQGPGYTAIDVEVSLPTIEAAKKALHAAMEEQ